MTASNTPSPQYIFQQLHHELLRKSQERDAELMRQAGGRALEYVLQPDNTAAQEEAIRLKGLLSGMALTKERYIGETRYSDGDFAAFPGKCLALFSSLADWEQKEAEETAYKLVDMADTHKDYKGLRIQVLRSIDRKRGVDEFRDLFKVVFAEHLPPMSAGSESAAS